MTASFLRAFVMLCTIACLFSYHPVHAAGFFEEMVGTAIEGTNCNAEGDITDPESCESKEIGYGDFAMKIRYAPELVGQEIAGDGQTRSIKVGDCSSMYGVQFCVEREGSKACAYGYPLVKMKIKDGTSHCRYMPPPPPALQPPQWSSFISDTCTDYDNVNSQYVLYNYPVANPDNPNVPLLTVATDKEGNPKKGSFIGVVVECIEDTMRNLFIPVEENGVSFFELVQINLTRIISGFLVLYVLSIGLKTVIMQQIPKKDEFIWYFLRFALVVYFTTGPGMVILYPQLAAGSKELSGIIMEAGLGDAEYDNYRNALLTTQELEAEQTTLTASLPDAQQEASDAASAITVASDNLVAARSTLTQKNAAADTALAAYQGAENALNGLINQRNQAQDNLNQLVGQENTISMEIANAQQAVATATSNLASTETNIANILATSNQAVQQATNDLATATATLASARTDLSQYQTAQTQLQTAQSSLNQANATLTQLQPAIDAQSYLNNYDATVSAWETTAASRYINDPNCYKFGCLTTQQKTTQWTTQLSTTLASSSIKSMATYYFTNYTSTQLQNQVNAYPANSGNPTALMYEFALLMEKKQEAQNLVTTSQTALASAQTEVQQAQNDVNAILNTWGDTAQIDSQVATLNTNIIDLKGSIAALTTAEQQALAEAQQNQANIDRLRAEAQQNLAAANTTLDAVRARATTNAAAIAAAQTTLNDLNTQITAATASRDALRTASDSALAERNLAQILANRAEIDLDTKQHLSSQWNQEVTRIQGRITDIGERLTSSQAAVETDYVSFAYNFCDFRNAQYGFDEVTGQDKGYMRLWDMVDCKLSKYFGVSRYAQERVPKSLIIITTAVFSSAWGIPIFVAGIISFIYLAMICIRIAHIYIIAFIAVVMLVYISPLIIPAVLFQYTKSIYNSWLNQLIGYLLQPVILFAFLTMMFAIMDRVVYDGNRNFYPDDSIVATNSQTSSSTATSSQTRDCPDPDTMGCIFEKATTGSTQQLPGRPTRVKVTGKLNLELFELEILWSSAFKNIAGQGKTIFFALLQLLITCFIVHAVLGTVESIAQRITNSSHSAAGMAIKAASPVQIAQSLGSAGKKAAQTAGTVGGTAVGAGVGGVAGAVGGLVAGRKGASAGWNFGKGVGKGVGYLLGSVKRKK